LASLLVPTSFDPVSASLLVLVPASLGLVPASFAGALASRAPTPASPPAADMGAEQLAVPPPFAPAQVQLHGPLPATAEGAPAAQSSLAGIALAASPLALPQAPSWLLEPMVQPVANKAEAKATVECRAKLPDELHGGMATSLWVESIVARRERDGRCARPRPDPMQERPYVKDQLEAPRAGNVFVEKKLQPKK
jgi:hypothetical protein